MPALGNPDLPFNAEPGSFIYIAPRGSSPGSPDRAFTGRFRCNLIAAVDTDGLLYSQPNKPYLLAGPDDAWRQCGKRSVARQMAEWAFARHPSGVDVFVTPIVMSTGSADTFNLYIVPIGTATAATGSGQMRIKIDDVEFPVDVTTGDLPATIAASLKARFDKYVAPTTGIGKGMPFASGIVAANAVPFTATVTGAWATNHPVAVNQDPTLTGVALSPGPVVFAAGPTGGASGTVTVNCAHKTVTVSGIASGQTNVQVCQAVVAAINAASDFPLSAQQRQSPDNDTFDFIAKPNRPFDRISVSVSSTITPMTATYTGESVGTGLPDLTNALAALEASDAMQEWATCFQDATSLGLLVQHIRTNGNGYHQKEQFLDWASSLSVTAAGALVSSISPSVVNEDQAQSSPGRNSAAWCQGAFQPAYNLAAMLACDYAFEPRITKNFDDRPILSNLPGMSVTYPDPMDRPSQATMNQARSTYFMTPLYVKAGNFLIQQRVSTYGGTLLDWASSSYVRGMAWIRQTCRSALAVFQGLERVDYSEPLTEYVFDTKQVEQVIYSALKRLELQNLYDGADKYRGLISASPDPTNPGWTRVYIPGSPPRENHVIAGQLGPTAQ